MNKNYILGIVGILAVLVLGWYFSGNRGMVENSSDFSSTASSTENVSTTTDVSATTTATSSPVTTAKTPTRVIPGYPSSWPSDVPRYPTEKVKYTGGNNPQTTAQEATVVFSTPDSVKSVVNFYLSGLKANGWKITEDGAGLANQITIRATKNRRGAGVYVERTADGKTNVTVGVNIGI